MNFMKIKKLSDLTVILQSDIYISHDFKSFSISPSSVISFLEVFPFLCMQYSF